MAIVEEFFDQLKARYSGGVPFKRICEDEGIIVAKARLDDGVNGFLISSNGHRLMVLNANIPYGERRDWAYHELWHHFKSPAMKSISHHANNVEEARADLFAALCRIEAVRTGDTIHDLVDRYSVSPKLARLRLTHEIRNLAR